MKADIEIAREASMKPVLDIAAGLGVDAGHLVPYGHYKAKIGLDYINSLRDRDNGKLVLVTAMSPTPAGEGKTTVAIGLADAMNRLQKRASVCLREPSLGPCFGLKGGAAGGGMSQVVPMEDINLHFTGDMHAIGAAHNLLAAMIDNYIHWGNDRRLDLRRMTWRRVVDINDRQLRQIVTGIGGPANGFPMEAGFDITVASEVMAIFCLARDLQDLQRRLGNIVIGHTREKEPVTAAEVQAPGAMTALLRDALAPNLVQTLENSPAFIHGGPFANIAHGCNSVIATETALKLSDYVVTEAGFGADLGAEKFFNIKCRKSGLVPDVAVIVVTVRALKMHGGVARDALDEEDVTALEAGLENLGRHIRNCGQYGVPLVVAINHFASDSDAEIAAITTYVAQRGLKAHLCTHHRDGGGGALGLAEDVISLADSGRAQFRTLYDDHLSLWEKARTVARAVYGADELDADQKVRDQFAQFEEEGYGHFPVCMAKTQYSFSTDPQQMGAPSNHRVKVRELVLAAGAEFLVVVCGDIMRMPGLPRKPAANNIHVNAQGQIEGLF
ncbi:formate--tetrahydrofolate ligase [Pseudohalioglobus sediminis]|uniref:Formate--tetrahydrofolate ligase n=1 Tax=Pseudohalioglobus sediminis TaxID=2606449 RepID=A0A5B0WPD2_9GAMM|nr:formate--tetrahydrofolate ligase [Pseudohalioglobus sediminis]KAA1188447.1 formate--tetrahydrofolate ligase [Pseudohalioglobus sediminis]